LTAIHSGSRLVLDAVEQTTRIVEGMHANIAAAQPPFGQGTNGSARGITGMVYDKHMAGERGGACGARSTAPFC
jgi:hypothetical protein